MARKALPLVTVLVSVSVSLLAALTVSAAVAAPPEGVSTILPAKKIASASDTTISTSLASEAAGVPASTMHTSTSSAASRIFSPEIQPSLASAPTHSRYFLLPGYDQTLISIGYGASSLQKPGDELTAQDYDVDFVYAFAKEWSAGISVGYNNTRIGELHQRGLKDIGLSLNRAEAYDNLTAIYGIELGISPGERVYATEATEYSNATNGNNFSGGYTFAPYWGFEKSLRAMTLGMKAQLKATTYPYPANANRNSGIGYNVEAFDEFLLNRDAGLGVVVGVGHSLYGNERGNLQTSSSFADTYSIGGYGFMSINPATAIQLSIGAESFNTIYTSDTTTTAGVALKTVL